MAKTFKSLQKELVVMKEKAERFEALLSAFSVTEEQDDA
jgi:hypothetical protein